LFLFTRNQAREWEEFKPLHNSTQRFVSDSNRTDKRYVIAEKAVKEMEESHERYL